MRKILSILVLLLITCSTGWGALKTNDKAPAFTLTDKDKREHSLKEFLVSTSSGTHGGVIAAFFASWCPECLKELPIFNSLVPEMSAKGITIVLIAVREDFDRIEPLLGQFKVDKPIVLTDLTGKVAEQYQVRFLPTTFFIGKDGRVKDMIFGGIDSKAEVQKSAETLTR